MTKRYFTTLNLHEMIHENSVKISSSIIKDIVTTSKRFVTKNIIPQRTKRLRYTKFYLLIDDQLSIYVYFL